MVLKTQDTDKNLRNKVQLLRRILGQVLKTQANPRIASIVEQLPVSYTHLTLPTKA